jgi:hypothetical protein
MYSSLYFRKLNHHCDSSFVEGIDHSFRQIMQILLILMVIDPFSRLNKGCSQQIKIFDQKNKLFTFPRSYDLKLDHLDEYLVLKIKEHDKFELQPKHFSFSTKKRR